MSKGITVERRRRKANDPDPFRDGVAANTPSQSNLFYKEQWSWKKSVFKCQSFQNVQQLSAPITSTKTAKHGQLPSVTAHTQAVIRFSWVQEKPKGADKSLE